MGLTRKEREQWLKGRKVHGVLNDSIACRPSCGLASGLAFYDDDLRKVTCLSCRKILGSSPKRVIHKTCPSWGVTQCMKDRWPNKINREPKTTEKWRDVTCKQCLRFAADLLSQRAPVLETIQNLFTKIEERKNIKDILERLHDYNNKMYDNKYQIVLKTDIYEAINEIERLRNYIKKSSPS